MSPPVWPDLDGVRRLWRLNPDVAYLNHGAFGATPVPVLDEQARLREELEHEPVDFLFGSYFPRVAAARREVAAFLNGDADGLVFVPNATAGMATAIAALRVRPGGEIVVTDHVYNAVRVAVHRLAAARRARVVVVPVDLPTTPDADLAAPVLDAIGPRTEAVVVDAITSPTALVLPVERIVRACRDRGVPVVVDGAHAPGHVPVDLAALGADFWVGNLHKWAFAPKAVGVLAVRAELRATTRPLVPSHGAGSGFLAEFDWTGTHEATTWLSAPAGLRFLAGLGPDAVRAHGQALAWWGACHVADAIGAQPPLAGAPHRHAMMALVDPGPLTFEQGVDLHDRLRALGVEVSVQVWRGRGFLRLSGQVYNRPEDYERLARALPDALRAARRAS